MGFSPSFQSYLSLNFIRIFHFRCVLPTNCILSSSMNLGVFDQLNVLVVGAGGIGCELLKNLVLENFGKITIIDLDTIDISNLNRQFLFQRAHVGRSKSEVAKESVSQFRPGCDIQAYYKSIFSSNFDSNFFSQFDLVFNALDNQAARRHVNRMCVASKKPLIESGTAGYLGQVEPLLPIPPHEGNLDRNNCVKVQLQTACYECQSRAADQRTYPACTIRNTPSEPIHCVIWAKYLFNQLFGEPDVSDEDVSPDLNDPELKLTSSDVTSFTHSLNNSESVSGLSSTTLRDWFQKLWKMNASGDHSPTLHVAARSLVWRLFHDDISTLTSMRDLWVDRQDRREPSVLHSSALDEAVSSKTASQPTLSASTCELRDQCTLPLTGWLRLFMDSVLALQNRFISGSCKALTWDKDDAEAMDFVASASIIRSMLFHLPGADKLTRFIIKSLAGNIIPAIATTNAIVAGLMVLQARQIVLGNSHNIKTLYLHRQSTGRAGNRRVVVPCQPPHPNPHCLVCSAKATKSMLGFHCCPSRLTLRTLRDQILIRHLGMLAPDVELEDRNIILISSEDGETDEATLNKTLTEFNVTHGSRLRCDDFLQDFTVSLVVSTAAPATLASSDHSDSQETTETTWQLVGDMQAARADVNSNKEISTELRVPNGTIEPVVSSDEADNARSSKRTSHTDEDADLQPTVHKRARMDSVGSNTDECVEIDEDDDLILLE